MRGRSLSLRLALTLSVAVAVVLLVAAIAVNQIVSRSLSAQLSTAQRDRMALLAEQLDGVDLRALTRRPGTRLVLDRVARSVGGRLQVLDGNDVLVTAGGLPPGAASTRVEEEVPGGQYRLVLEIPSAGQPFLRVFNLTLLVAGLLSVVALIGAAAVLADRVTRPLRGVAVAARRLGAGDLAARAEGGPDRESAELAEAFNAMAARLEQSEALRRRAASDVAHDLATPATVLESQLQAMIDGVVPADAEQLQQARATAGAMSSLISQLRELVDAESAALQRRPAAVPVAELMSEARGALESLFRERGVALQVQAAPDLTAWVDAVQVGRALRNVLTNAAQHAPAGSEVSAVAAAEPDGAIVIRVTDRGPGIAADDLPHVFERFYRADTARSRGASGSGGGIGLTIARDLLRANHGDVSVERTTPGETVLAIRLPASRAIG
jgi:two-component system sensor histidine kinase BaeS